MANGSRQHFPILVIGGGPAGMAAAVRAAEHGERVGILDDNFSLGGQIWRSALDGPAPEAAPWVKRLRTANVTLLSGVRVVHQPTEGTLLAEGMQDLYELAYDKLVLATGARERFLPFPGWTLPNVMGAGGLQAMVKSGLPVDDKRVVVAGTGPLLLAVAAYLRKHGAKVLRVCEQASWTKLARFTVALLGQPGKLLQGLQLKRELRGVPYSAGAWPVAAKGKEVLESVCIWCRGKIERIPCDYLACGFHLVPNIELAALLGCEARCGCVQVDDLQRTSVPTIFCAGEPTGIGGVELALVEGQIAGLAACGQIAEARELFSLREKLRRFARAMDRAFRLRSELRDLPTPETIVCRCEDVSYARLSSHTNWRAAKLQTRCGMGPCQGRVCGPATQFLFKWKPDSVRPPIFPVRVDSLAHPTGCQVPAAHEVTGGHG